MEPQQELTLEQLTEPNPALESQVQLRILSQLQRPIRLVFVIRLLAPVIIGTVAIGWLIATGAHLAWVVAAIAVLVGVVVVFSRPVAKPDLVLSPKRLRVVAASVLLMQTLAIAITGGLESPVIVVYVAALILSAVVTGDVRAVIAGGVVALCGMTVFWFVEIFAPGTLPALSPEASRLVLGVAVLFVAAFGATAGLTLRRAFERSVRAEVMARASAIDLLSARNRELKELGSSLAHELKNPLAAIQGLTMQQLRNAEEGSRDAERLAVVVGEVKRMSKVLEEFLSFSRPFADVEKADTDLVGLVDAVLAMYADHLEGLGIAAERSGDTEIVAPCDARQLNHVLVNLLLNAIDVSEPGSKIQVELHHSDASAIVELRDEGPGLHGEALERAFDPGFTTRTGGNGLGLAICRGIVNAHGGTLTLENRPEGGCTARIELPLKVES